MERATTDPTNVDVTTVGVDGAVLHRRSADGVVAHRLDGLPPDTEIEEFGVTFRTLPHPGGELLCSIATVNDVHFGETRAGVVEGQEELIGPILSVQPGETPYPETMNQAAVTEIVALDPALVVAKGDLTADGTDDEYAAFLRVYGILGDRLVHVRGNHDAYRGQTFAAEPTQRVDLPGLTVAVLDTTTPRATNGRVTPDQAEWLDAVGADADRPVLVFGHHHAWDPSSSERPDTYFGIHPDSSERLVDVVARRRTLRGYFAGHTHRNRVRQFAATGDVPWVEVACVKDFPGTWAEYQVYEGGVVQLAHRISVPEALAWSERCRHMYLGTYEAYALGQLSDRCFVIPT